MLRVRSAHDKRRQILDRKASPGSSSRRWFLPPDLQSRSSPAARSPAAAVYRTAGSLHRHLFPAGGKIFLRLPPPAFRRTVALLRRSAAARACDRRVRGVFEGSAGKRPRGRRNAAGGCETRIMVCLPREGRKIICSRGMHRSSRLRLRGFRTGKARRANPPLSAAPRVDREVHARLDRRSAPSNSGALTWPRPAQNPPSQDRASPNTELGEVAEISSAWSAGVRAFYCPGR